MWKERETTDITDFWIRFSKPYLRRVCLVELIGPVWWAGTSDVNAYQSISEAEEFNSVLDKNVVGIAVQPALARLSRSYHRMSAGVRVFGGVFVRRAIAAQRYAACLTRPQMHPVATDLYALFAFGAFRLLNRVDRIKMRTAAGAHDLFTVVVFCSLTSCAAMPNSCGCRRRPFRPRQLPRRNA